MANKLRIESAIYQQLLSQLQAHYPDCFVETGDRILKKHIHRDINNESKVAMSITLLRKVLKVYTSNSVYEKAHYVGAKRYNLKGEVVDEVSEKEVTSVTNAKQQNQARRETLTKENNKGVKSPRSSKKQTAHTKQ